MGEREKRQINATGLSPLDFACIHVNFRPVIAIGDAG